MSKGFREIVIAIAFFSCGALMYLPFSIIVLEPLGFLDKHVSQVPEGPNTVENYGGMVSLLLNEA